jgi:hypothetical protein
VETIVRVGVSEFNPGNFDRNLYNLERAQTEARGDRQGRKIFSTTPYPPVPQRISKPRRQLDFELIIIVVGLAAAPSPVCVGLVLMAGLASAG